MSVRIITGDCRERLRELPAQSVHTCVTSPPYFGLRDYGHAGQIGLEDTPDAFVAQMVEVFREVRRVLRDDGTLWLNLGDSYANDTKWGGATSGKHVKAQHGDSGIGRRRHKTGLKSKDRMMIPARTALALQADGWWLRDEIVWSKPNAMPSPVSDRTTSSHEMIYLLTKGEKYYYDDKAIQEEAVSDHPSGNGFKRPARLSVQNADGTARGNDAQWTGVGGKRNKRSVWSVPTQPFSEAHFATYPPDLIEPCILAGCPVGGTVLDPFGGAGTTGMVSDRLGRSAILIELNAEYAALAERRLHGDAGMFADVVAA